MFPAVFQRESLQKDVKILYIQRAKGSSCDMFFYGDNKTFNFEIKDIKIC